MDDNIVYATAQSEQLPVDLGAGHIVAAARLQLVILGVSRSVERDFLSVLRFIIGFSRIFFICIVSL